MFEPILQFIRKLYGTEEAISLHAPVFLGEEKKYLSECIDSTYVSTVGPYVDTFEKRMADYTGAKFAVSTVNGTAALHAALLLAGVKPGDEVLTQALTFVSAANAISYCYATPVLFDSVKENLGLDPMQLNRFFEEHCKTINGQTVNSKTGKRIAACIPMHVFGHAASIEKINDICAKHSVPVIEDAAEALGSRLNGQHLGTFSLMGVLSFNGNKSLTTGGGGMILTNDAELAKKAKHLTTTARLPHSWEFIHDQVGYNYRMPNLNAALGCAQLEYFDKILENKRETASLYEKFFATQNLSFQKEPPGNKSNYWLNAFYLKDKATRDQFLKLAIDQKIYVRPAWPLLDELPMYAQCQKMDHPVASEIRDRLVNLPSSYRKTP